MNLTPPPGSSISVTTADGEPLIVIPSASGGFTRIFPALFLAFWLCGWAFGFFRRDFAGDGGQRRLVPRRLVSAWMIGGIMAVFFLYRLLRPSDPESLRLGLSGVTYDSGIPPFRYDYYRYGRFASRRTRGHRCSRSGPP